MPFVNEYIQKEDFEKFNFSELNKRKKKGGGTANHWTIDQKADVWLRKFYTESDHTEPGGGFTGVSVWDYYWKGHLMMIEIKTLEIGGDRGKHCWARRRLLSINIPHELKSQRPQILKDLETAFTAYKDGGIFSSSTSFNFSLEM